MDKNEMQAQELDQISGGAIDVQHPGICPSCKARYNKSDKYPNGFLVKEESHGCSSSTWYFKCPGCGHEWTE